MTEPPDRLQNVIEVGRGGVPVLKGTRFTVSQTLAELAESSGVPAIAERFDLDENTIRSLLLGLALFFGIPASEE